MSETQFISGRQEAITSTHKVLRNTYLLLSMTLLFSAGMAGVAIAMDAPPMGLLPLLVAFALIFAINKFRNSVWGIALVFAFTGFLGFCMGPIVSYYMATTGGSQIVMTAMGLTGLIFFSLSGYTLVTKKDFSFMAGFLTTGLWVVLGCMLIMFVGGFFGWHVPGLHLAISAAVVILMSGFILFDTSRILNGGETNYIMATVSMYLSIYNIFQSLLILLGAMDE